jgi:peptidoglycan/xylan/chitin deacetylase (PgdA/CDA1 family)
MYHSERFTRSSGAPAQRLFMVVALLLASLWMSVGVAGPEVASAAATSTGASVVVSLTYDDGTADQIQAGSLMGKYGMRGTFYINSGRLGSAGYMRVSDALDLQAAGNEIGGHTVSHADLPTLSTDEARRQVCNDRVNLLNAGLTVKNFAYPYGDENANVQQVVQDCGYNSARGVGDIVSPGTCSGCAYAEGIPPTNPWALKTPDSIKNYTTLEDMENYVLQAEQHGGGWVPLVMHHVCNGCDPYSVTPVQLDTFLSWLSARASRGTVVKTVDQVMGGSLKPSVDGPPAPSPLSTTNLLRNPSMEELNATTGVPTCWQRGGYGTNSYNWSNSTDAQDGANAQSVTISNFVDGDRKMISPQDLGACAPPTKVGHTYQVHAWYKSNGNVRLVANYRNSLGGWSFLAQGPVLPTSSTYVQAQWTTPAMPAGSTALSVGFSLRSNGYLLGDNLQLNDTDQTAPTVAITSPADGTRVRNTVTFKADASDASGVDHVDFMVDGATVCTAKTSPYSCDYDTTTHADSVIAVTARAVDTAGNVGLSRGRNYTVSNSVPLDTLAPVVSVDQPQDGGVVNGDVTLTAAASDDDGVNQVLFYVNGNQVGADNSAPFETVWDSTTVADGTVTVVAKALDLSGNLGTSAPISLTVTNTSLDSVPPVSSIQCNNAACSTGWYTAAVTVVLSAQDGGSGVDRIVYTLDGSDPSRTNGSVYSSPFTVNASATVKFRAFDLAGNAEDVQSTALRVDTVAPTASVSAPANGSTITGTTYIVAGVSDNVSIARVWFYLDGKSLGSRTVSPWQWKWDTTTTTKGAHTLQVVAIDSAGNQTKSAPITVTVS